MLNPLVLLNVLGIFYKRYHKGYLWRSIFGVITIMFFINLEYKSTQGGESCNLGNNVSLPPSPSIDKEADGTDAEKDKGGGFGNHAEFQDAVVTPIRNPNVP